MLYYGVSGAIALPAHAPAQYRRAKCGAVVEIDAR